MCASPPPRPCSVEGPAIRALEPAQADLHCAVAAEGFGVPVRLFAALMSPAVVALPEFRMYIGEVLERRPAWVSAPGNSR